MISTPTERDELLQVVTEFRAGILDGRSSQWMCRMVCLPLQGYLSACGIETKIIDGYLVDKDGDELGHTWLALPDNSIIDPTADQFSTSDRPMPPVYIGKQPKWYSTASTQPITPTGKEGKLVDGKCDKCGAKFEIYQMAWLWNGEHIHACNAKREHVSDHCYRTDKDYRELKDRLSKGGKRA